MLELAAGEMSLHHVRLIHGSDPNPSDDRRIGFAIRYIPTYVRQVAGSHDSATLVRGEDRHGNFEHEQRPDADMSEAAVAYHAADHRRARADPDARHRAGDAGLARWRDAPTQRLHLLEPFGHVANHRRDADHVARIVAERRDGKLYRDARAVLADGRYREHVTFAIAAVPGAHRLVVAFPMATTQRILGR